MSLSLSLSQQQESEKNLGGSHNDKNDGGVPRECISCDNDATICAQINPRHKCSRCKSVYYCSKDCQKQHWRRHKPDCDAGYMAKQQCIGLRQEDNFTDPAKKTITPVNDECPICLLSPSLEGGKSVVLNACRHQFCFSCLKNWQQQSSSIDTSTSSSASSSSSSSPPPCPLCRNEMAQDVVQEAMEHARLLASRANQLERRRTSDDENKVLEQAQELRNQAMEEIDRVLEGDEDPHLQALVTKAEILKQSRQYQQALQVFDQIIALDNERHERSARVVQLLNRVDQASAMGQVDVEAETLLGQLEEEIKAGNKMQHVFGTRLDGVGPSRQADILICKAETMEDMKKWDQAKEVYCYLLQLDDFYENAKPPQHRAVLMGLSRCAYHVGHYDKAIASGQAALEMNRHFPDVHKYIALSQKAQGMLETAVQTMNRAALYETPWDDEHRQDVLKLYQELKAELDATSADS